MNGMLYGVGTGPGDPELITLKALKVIQEADLILTLRNERDEENSALSVMLYHLKEVEARHREVVLPSKGRCQTFMDFWLETARIIQKALEKGSKVVFAVPEDPGIFSTFSYLVDVLEGEMDDLPVEVIPGINLYSAAAAFLKIPLVMENERLTVLQAPVTTDELSEFCRSFDAVVILKGKPKIKEIMGSLEKLDLLEKTYFLVYSRLLGQFLAIEQEDMEEKDIEGELLVLIKSY